MSVVRGTPLAFHCSWSTLSFPNSEFGQRILVRVPALAVNCSAYGPKSFRLGLQAVPRGQMEAAVSLGMPRTLAVRRIILPQAVREHSADGERLIVLFKDTAVCSVIATNFDPIFAGGRIRVCFSDGADGHLYLLMSYPVAAGRLARAACGPTNAHHQPACQTLFDREVLPGLR